jgi:hypothetical protein
MSSSRFLVSSRAVPREQEVEACAPARQQNLARRVQGGEQVQRGAGLDAPGARSNAAATYLHSSYHTANALALERLLRGSKRRRAPEPLAHG